MRGLLKDDGLLVAVEKDWRSAPLTEKRKAMLEYATKLTLLPSKVTSRDVDQLRRAGFSDRDVLDIAEVTAYYAYANRIADGLGVPVETWVED
ncbi:MAG TPA: peroxidase [Acidimicrobiaceae bacterium]|nr:peroxidase [Acidimicrobiaceae bacterium]